MSKKNENKRDRKKNKGKKGIESAHRRTMENIFFLTIGITIICYVKQRFY